MARTELDTPRHLRLVKNDARDRRDERVARAIDLMHEQLAARWTVEKLAKRVGLSRPAFARKFVESTGRSPMRYLTDARMERAAELLRGSPDRLAQIGAQVGYDSEFAFNRAFKRVHRVAPGTFRRLASATTAWFRAAA